MNFGLSNILLGGESAMVQIVLRRSTGSLERERNSTAE